MAKDQDSDYDDEDNLNSESNESSTSSSDDTDSNLSVDTNADGEETYLEESDNESTDTNTTGYVDTHPDIVTAIKKILPAFAKCLASEQTQYVSDNSKIRNVYRSNPIENALMMGIMYKRASRELDDANTPDTDTNTDTNQDKNCDKNTGNDDIAVNITAETANTTYVDDDGLSNCDGDDDDNDHDIVNEYENDNETPIYLHRLCLIEDDNKDEDRYVLLNDNGENWLRVLFNHNSNTSSKNNNSKNICFEIIEQMTMSNSPAFIMTVKDTRPPLPSYGTLDEKSRTIEAGTATATVTTTTTNINKHYDGDTNVNGDDGLNDDEYVYIYDLNADLWKELERRKLTILNPNGKIAITQIVNDTEEVVIFEYQQIPSGTTKRSKNATQPSPEIQRIVMGDPHPKDSQPSNNDVNDDVNDDDGDDDDDDDGDDNNDSGIASGIASGSGSDSGSGSGSGSDSGSGIGDDNNKTEVMCATPPPNKGKRTRHTNINKEMNILSASASKLSISTPFDSCESPIQPLLSPANTPNRIPSLSKTEGIGRKLKTHKTEMVKPKRVLSKTVPDDIDQPFATTTSQSKPARKKQTYSKRPCGSVGRRESTKTNNISQRDINNGTDQPVLNNRSHPNNDDVAATTTTVCRRRTSLVKELASHNTAGCSEAPIPEGIIPEGITRRRRQSINNSSDINDDTDGDSEDERNLKQAMANSLKEK